MGRSPDGVSISVRCDKGHRMGRMYAMMPQPYGSPRMKSLPYFYCGECNEILRVKTKVELVPVVLGRGNPGAIVESGPEPPAASGNGGGADG